MWAQSEHLCCSEAQPTNGRNVVLGGEDKAQLCGALPSAAAAVGHPVGQVSLSIYDNFTSWQEVGGQWASTTSRETAVEKCAQTLVGCFSGERKQVMRVSKVNLVTTMSGRLPRWDTHHGRRPPRLLHLLELGKHDMAFAVVGERSHGHCAVRTHHLARAHLPNSDCRLVISLRCNQEND